ncbi:MAG: hypothetical protein ACOCZE_12055 [Planctomycetota bacterium]
MIRFSCAGCGHSLQAPNKAAGKKARCPHCRTVTPIPFARGASDAADPSLAAAAQAGPGRSRPRRTKTEARPSRGPWYVAGAAAVVLVGVITTLVIFHTQNAGGEAESMIGQLDRPDPKNDPVQPRPATDAPAADDSQVPPQPQPGQQQMAGAFEQSPTAEPPARPASRAAMIPSAGHSGNWDLNGRAEIQAIRFGGTDITETYKDRKGNTRTRVIGDRITDMRARPDGSLIVCGLIQNADAIPTGLQPQMLLPGSIGRNSAFVARISADLSEMKWISVFPSEAILPERLAVGGDGTIAITGEVGKRTADLLPEGKWNNQAAIAKICPDGARLHWMIPGGPNQTKGTGVAIDPQGRVYWTAGTRGSKMAAYVLKTKPDSGERSDWAYEGTAGWALVLHDNDPQLLQEGEYWHFYKRGRDQGEKKGYFDYDGPGGWNEVKVWTHGIRQGGQVELIGQDEMLVSGTHYYSFVIKGQPGNPAFDAFLARYTRDGKLIWSSNLYQPGDSVHTPDQKPGDMVYHAPTGDIYVLFWQHGSNQYRFKGKLVGDTGNLSIWWVGRVNGRTGQIVDGWYFHNPKPNNKTLQFDKNGIPAGWPKLAGNNLRRLATDDAGRVYVAGKGAAVTFTTPNAHQAWPGKQWGHFGTLQVLSPDLQTVHYATMIRPTATDAEGNVAGTSDFHGLAVTSGGVYLAGSVQGQGFVTGDQPAWARAVKSEQDCTIVRMQWD